MKIVFIQDIMFEYFGPMMVSALLKKAGHSVDIVIPHNKNYIDELKDANLIALSCMSELSCAEVEGICALVSSF